MTQYSKNKYILYQYCVIKKERRTAKKRKREEEIGFHFGMTYKIAFIKNSYILYNFLFFRDFLFNIDVIVIKKLFKLANIVDSLSSAQLRAGP